MTEGAAYVGSWLTRSRRLPIWNGGRGENMLDGGAFYYGTYETSDGKYMSVGALEPQFFSQFINVLGLEHINQFDNSEENKRKVTEIFKTKTQKEWSALFETLDACVFPVLDWTNANQHPQNNSRDSFVSSTITGDSIVPSPAPKLSRTPAISGVQKIRDVKYMEQVKEICNEAGLNDKDIEQFIANGALISPMNSKL